MAFQDDKDRFAQLVNHDNVTGVLEFFEKYEVNLLTCVCVYCQWLTKCDIFNPLKAKIADLDARLFEVSEEKRNISERIAVLKINARKAKPDKNAVTHKTIRYYKTKDFFKIETTPTSSPQECLCWLGC